MATIRAVDFERSGITRGIKTALFVLVLTAGAVAADHMFFVAPSTKPAASPMAVQAATVNTATPDGFALPENLKPTAADAIEQPPTF
jgi:hypothetical protein